MHFFKNSTDELGKTLYLSGAAALLLSLFFRYGTAIRFILTAIGAICIIYGLYRSFSSNASLVSTQNLKYLAAVTSVRDYWRKLFKKNPSNTAKSTAEPSSAGAASSSHGTTGTASARNAKKPHAKVPSFQDIKNYKYFTCPQCAQRLRVPRGKGTLRVTCTKCGKQFNVKS